MSWRRSVKEKIKRPNIGGLALVIHKRVKLALLRLDQRNKLLALDHPYLDLDLNLGEEVVPRH